MTRTRKMVLVLMLVAAAALEVRQLEASRGAGDEETAKATFAGGCFWCMEPPFDKLDGVISTMTGYIGGQTETPTYEEVSSGTTGHTEAVEVVYEPKKVTRPQLLDVFWRNIDPLMPNRLEESGQFDDPIVTEVVPAPTFYPAEGYHQDYYQKNPVR